MSKPSKHSITEAIRVLLGSAPEECVEHATRRVAEGAHLAHAVSEWLQTKKLKAGVAVAG